MAGKNERPEVPAEDAFFRESPRKFVKSEAWHNLNRKNEKN
jgi:hypothetical protein